MSVIRVPIGSDGPVVDLGLWLSRVAAQALIARGGQVPAPQTVRALIDTGADRTAIHPIVLRSIHSPPAGTARVRRPGGASAFRSVDLHDVRLAIAGTPTPSIPAAWVEIEAVAVAPANPSILALIGRDMLAHSQFFYDGWRGELLLID
jgi:predicted aspartyl protease